MDDLKQPLNFEFSRLMQSPVVAFPHEFAHSLQLVILIFENNLTNL